MVDGSASVNDSLKGSLGTFSAEETSPKVVKYECGSAADPAGQCTTHENIATLETSTTKTKMSASANVKHCVGADLTASVNSKPSFTRTYHWTINKTASPGEQTTSGPATFGYKVTVAHDGGLDSAWQVTGDATVKNPNAWESVTLTGVTVTVNNGGWSQDHLGQPDRDTARRRRRAARLRMHVRARAIAERVHGHGPGKLERRRGAHAAGFRAGHVGRRILQHRARS